ncbi:NF-kappa-B essential modulator-like isoform X3 [Ctenocephalides felis]|uniref:NF-kappa-B essential modulator-like isoform X3 n=2 Tax=Ctenocephalides felis TaxID=7515 RepID=UPI000E6E59DE|nr:NF-kappa-B essential modulator-like isoform X3 [Ctenocephalides felis]
MESTNFAETSHKASGPQSNKSFNENDDESFVILGSSPSESMNHVSAQNSLCRSVNDTLIASHRSILEKIGQQNQSLLYSNISYPSPASVSQSLIDSINIKNMTQDEIQRQFNVLIQENCQMKENLMQNNNDLRREFNKIMKYQEEVRKIHDGHREKFEETRKLVIKLKTENAMLKENLKTNAVNDELINEKSEMQKRIDDLTSTLNNLQTQNTSLMGQLSESTLLTSELEKQIEKLNLKNVQSEETINLITNEKQNLERELERSSLEMNISNERNAEMKATIDNLKAQVTNLMANQHKSDTVIIDLNSEIKLYKEQLQKAHMKLTADKSDYELVSNSDVGLSNSNISIFNAPSASVETISRLREEIQNLQMQLKECSLNQVKLTMDPLSLSMNHNFSYSESGSYDLEKKVQFYEKHLQDIINWYNAHCKRMNMLQYILKDVQPENITSVQQVETKLKELQQFSNELCESLSKEWILLKTAQSNFQTIYNEYNNLLKEMESINTANKLNEDVHQKEIEKMNADMLKKDELLQLKSDEILKKQEEIDNLKKDQPEIDVLKQQLDIYKEDFETERKARATLAGEKDNAVSDLRKLQQRNEELLQRLKNIAEQNKSTAAPTAPPNDNSSSSTQMVYPCPICQFAFYTIQALENHVERCLNAQV